MKKIAVFVHHPACSVQSVNGIVQALSHCYSFKIFTRHSIEYDFFQDVDAVVIPGGLGDANQFDHLFYYNKTRIQEFVQQGGAYVGICMGAYWAGSNYFNLVKEIDVVQYLHRPGSDTNRPHAKNIDVTWKNKKMKMFWYDGCAMIGNEKKFKTIARYSANLDPMAIVQGRIGLIGCHPESTLNWYMTYSWLKGQYHSGEHHCLLREFVDQVIGV